MTLVKLGRDRAPKRANQKVKEVTFLTRRENQPRKNKNLRKS